MVAIPPELIAQADALDDAQLWLAVLRPHLNQRYNWRDLLLTVDAMRIRDLLARQVHVMNNDMAERKARVEAILADRERSHHECVQARQDYGEWHAKVLVYKKLLEARLVESRRYASDARQRRHEETNDRERQYVRDTLRRLAQAVAEHQRACHEDGLEPSRADLKLWAMLDELTIPYVRETITLSRAIDLLWGDQ